MPKPGWLIKKDSKILKHEPDTCSMCKNFKGFFIGYTKHKAKDKCEIWECKIHPRCHNTQFSIVCSDFDEDMML